MRHQPATPQHGMAVLAMVMILLFGISLIVLYLNRSIIFEQRISANQMRSTMAQEMAEAGIEWATGMFNRAEFIGTNCQPLAGGSLTFRKQYVTVSPTPGIASHVLPGCKLNPATGVSLCHCPAVPASGTTLANLGSASLPGFTVQFSPVAGDAEAVRVIATGCTEQADTCGPGTRGASDASASVSVVLKLMPGLRAVPAAPLTCGLSCSIGGSFDIVNQDVATGGILVNAGSTVSASASQLTTIPGQPMSGAIIDNDPSLLSLASSDPTCSNSSMFSAFFGSTVAEYMASPLTKTISCSTANDCGQLIGAAYNAGWRAFYFPLSLEINNSAPFSQLGTATDGVSLVSPGQIDINGNISLYGMLFSNSSNFNNLGTGTANIYGAMVTCGGFNSNGNGTVNYLPSALSSTRTSSARMVRMPGSWTDRCALSLPLPTVANAAPTINCN